DVERACREAQRPLPARQLDRVERTGERLLRAVSPASGRRRLRAIPAEQALVLVDALGDLPDALNGQGEEPDGLGRRGRGVAVGRGRGAGRGRGGTGSSGPNATRWPGRPSTCPRSCASVSGTTGRPPCSSPRP